MIDRRSRPYPNERLILEDTRRGRPKGPGFPSSRRRSFSLSLRGAVKRLLKTFKSYFNP